MLAAVSGLLFPEKVVPVLGPVLPRPNGVPKQAAASYEFKVGMVWSWRHVTPGGCATWTATQRWAAVTFYRDRQTCGGKRNSLAYVSYDEHVVFDWGRGTWSGGEPCPFTVPPEEIAAYAGLVDEALKAAVTDKERALLAHIELRLTNLDGEALTTDHTGGCNDLKAEDYKAPPRRHQDKWYPD